MADLAAAKELEDYSLPYLKNCVEEDFKRQIVITSVNRNVDVVTFHTTAAKILQDFQNRKASDEIEVGKMRIIKVSADIIKNEIKQLAITQLFIQQLKKSRLRMISHYQSLSHLISCKNSDLLLASIAQTIIQNTRSRSIITTIQLSLAVILHRHFKSRYLTDILHKFGRCVSYSKVLHCDKYRSFT